jgi:tetratricopeptide (TPR) repeat protein
MITAINKTYNTDRDQVFIIKKIMGKFCDISFIIIVILLSILTIRPCIAYYTHSYGEEYVKKADLNKAEELFRWAILFDPGNTSYHYSLSAATFNKFQKGKDPSLIDETISEINYAMKLNPINTLFPSRLAFVYQYLGMATKDSLAKARVLKEAEKNYKISIGLAPFYAPNYAGLAEIYLISGDKEQAKIELMKALDLEPRFLPARYQLAIIYQGEGKIELAEAEYRAIIEIKETYADKVQNVMEEEYLGVDITDVKKRLGLLKSR